MAEEWIPIRALADRRGVTPDAIQKQLKRGRLDLPWRRTNTGRLEVLVDLETLPAQPEPDVSPVLAVMEERIEDLQGTIQRLILERDAERAWREHEQAGRHTDAAQHAEQLARELAALSSDMSTRLATEASKTGQAQQEAEALKREADILKQQLASLRGRSLLNRLFNREPMLPRPHLPTRPTPPKKT